MNNGTHRSLPLRVPPSDGEALDSWLLRLAHRNGMSAQWLLNILGLDDRIRVWHNHTLVQGLPNDLLRRLELQTGLKPHRLDQAVLDRYQQLGWKPTVGSRYCTACLTHNGGAWPIRWQLPYTFACLHHRCLLAGVCPACHQTPHSGLSDQSGLLPLHRCTIRPHKRGDVCGADLLTHPTHRLAADDTRLAAQRWIDERLDVMDGSASTDLRDLDALGVWLRQRIGPDDIRHLGEATTDAVARYRDPRYHDAQRRQQLTTPIVTAAIAAHAVDLITAADGQTRYRLFSPLFRLKEIQQSRSVAPPQAPMILSQRRMTKLSAALQQQLLASCDPYLPVSERLRHRTCTTTPRLTAPEATLAAERARHIPQYLWHDWIVRFQPPTGAHVDTLATDIPVALMIPGNPVRNKHATAELNRWRPNVAQTLRLLADHHQDALSAICALSDYLDTHGAPIDYRRRRAIFTDVELSRQDWEKLCARADAHPGRARRQLQARQHIFQLLTGADLSNPQHALAFHDPLERTYYLNFQTSLTTQLRDVLQHHAAQTLQAAGINEPLTWTPPPSCVSGLTLPGRDPHDIDMDALHRLLVLNKTSVQAAAKRLGVTVEHVRHAQQHLHRPAPTHAKNSPANAHKVRERAAATLTAEFFQREHIQAGKNLDTIAAETGISRKLLIHYAQQSGVKLIGAYRRTRLRTVPARRREPIEPDWLREHAGARRRTNGDIAAEVGLSHETIRRYRKNLNLPSRPTGSEGHVVTNLRHPQLPKEVRRAVEGQRHGWQRLRRFQEIQTYPSMNAAAQGLGLHTSNLNLQIRRLETDLDKKLLNRGHRYQPMTPTEPGRRLLDQLGQASVRELLDLFAG